MMRIPLLALLASAVPLLGFTGCKDSSTTGRYETETEILIGEYASLTGGTANFGQSSHQGLKLAIKEINEAGGVLGKKIRIITEDNKSELNEASTAVQKLISRDKVAAVIGEVASSRSFAGASICQKEKIPMLSPASTNPGVTETGDYIFRICFTDAFQGPVLATFAEKQGWKNVAIFTDLAQDYSKGLSDAFRKTYLESGGTIVADQSYRTNDPDFRAQLNTIKAANPSAVFLPGYYTEVGLIVRQAREMGLDVPFFGGDGWDSPETLALGDAVKNCYFANHYSADDPRPEVQAFVRAYQAEYGRTPDAMAILGYDAGRVLADAIRRAGKADPEAIRDALAATTDFPGASGTITIDANRNARKPIVIVSIVDGRTKIADAITPE